ncbi:pre-mRNA-splicing factor SYF1-like [Thalictrum thalictroides]|uniref:Pre-mRNA-splicing factor SYF1-like n=1 Tax=Thalictrum thalictroides TaxID=46969 RepID=A0A7J6WAB2_THATH|nr:pre-mRNA-splicing factor SYF1-like [Thalictrum thalictroides]
MNYTHLDHLTSLWFQWVDLELTQENTSEALELMRRTTTEPAVEVRQRFASVGYEPLQMKLHKSLRLWQCYLGMEENLDTLESARIAYERMLDYKIASPQIIISYAWLLERHKLFDEAVVVFERGLKMFDYPRATGRWISYISQYVRRYGKIKLERVRELFDRAREMTPAEFAEPLYRHYTKLEKDFVLAKCAMKLNDQAAKFVPGDDDKMSLYENCISCAAKIFGVPK